LGLCERQGVQAKMNSKRWLLKQLRMLQRTCYSAPGNNKFDVCGARVGARCEVFRTQQLFHFCINKIVAVVKCNPQTPLLYLFSFLSYRVREIPALFSVDHSYACIFQELSSLQDSVPDVFLCCSHACCGSRPSLLFNYRNVVSWGLPIMNPLVMELSPAYFYIFFRKSRCSYSTLFSNIFSLFSSLTVRDPSVTPFQIASKSVQNVVNWMVAVSLLMEFYFVTVILNQYLPDV
jgi:hypothetical protein